MFYPENIGINLQGLLHGEIWRRQVISNWKYVNKIISRAFEWKVHFWVIRHLKLTLVVVFRSVFREAESKNTTDILIAQSSTGTIWCLWSYLTKILELSRRVMSFPYGQNSMQHSFPRLFFFFACMASSSQRCFRPRSNIQHDPK